MKYNSNHKWIKEFSAAIVVCDKKGIIIEMNDRAVEYFQEYGGDLLIGKNMFDCHPDRAKVHLQKAMDSERISCDIFEKNGKKEVIYQSPWYEKGEFRGMVQIILDITYCLSNYYFDL